MRYVLFTRLDLSENHYSALDKGFRWPMSVFEHSLRSNRLRANRFVALEDKAQGPKPIRFSDTFVVGRSHTLIPMH